MKILFITDLYPIKWSDNNSPKTLHQFVKEWIDSGHKVDVIKPNFLLNSFLRKKPFYAEGVYDFDDVSVINVNYISPFLFDIEKKLPKNLDVSSYDLIIAHMPSGIIYANKLAKKYDKKLVCGVHCSDIAVLRNPIYKFYFRSSLVEAYKRASKIACRSYVLKNKIEKILPEVLDKTFVAPSGISPEIVHEREVGISHPVKIVTCANLIKRKNVDKLICAIKDMKDVRLRIIGDGPQMHYLKHLVNKFRLGLRVEFDGNIDKTEVITHFKNSHIFILPSVSETFGLVYLEAMSQGCITVCTKNDGIDGIIKDGVNGFLCNSDVGSLRNVIEKIVLSGKLSDIVKNAYDTLKELTPQKVAQDYIEQISD